MRTSLIILFASLSMSVSAGSLESGEQPYERCALCHGLYGISSHPKFPHLAGQNAQYLENQILMFLDGTRTNDGGQMQTVVTEIAETDINAIVTWFSSQEPPQPSQLSDIPGADLFTSSGCINCHLENKLTDDSIPLLHAQHKTYLEKQMLELRSGDRSGNSEPTAHGQLEQLNNSEISAIAAYLSARERTQ